MTLNIDPERLREYELLGQLESDRLESVMRTGAILEQEKGSCFIHQGTSDEWIYFLLEGTVELIAKDGRRHRIQSGSRGARSPIVKLKPYQYDVVATSPARIVRFDSESLLDEESCQVPDYGVKELAGEHDMSQAGLCIDILHDMEDDKLTLPSLPDRALHIRRIIKEDEVDADTLAQLIVSDIAMTAKIVRAANSALYTGSMSVGSCSQAIVRLGLETTSRLVFCFAMQQLFQFRSPALMKRMHELWRHSSEVASIAFMLARTNRCFEPESALLAGLMHDIGVTCVLTYSERRPEYAHAPDGIEKAISQLHCQLGGLILRNWNFPENIVMAAEECDNWERKGRLAPDYGDLIIVAQLLSLIRSGKKLPIAEPVTLPAMQKFFQDEATMENALEFLESSREQIAEMEGILSSSH